MIKIFYYDYALDQGDRRASPCRFYKSVRRQK
ncbi:hypothetical protein J2Z29_002387 [Treponema pedis]